MKFILKLLCIFHLHLYIKRKRGGLLCKMCKTPPEGRKSKFEPYLFTSVPGKFDEYK